MTPNGEQTGTACHSLCPHPTAPCPGHRQTAPAQPGITGTRLPCRSQERILCSQKEGRDAGGDQMDCCTHLACKRGQLIFLHQNPSGYLLVYFIQSTELEGAVCHGCSLLLSPIYLSDYGTVNHTELQVQQDPESVDTH